MIQLPLCLWWIGDFISSITIQTSWRFVYDIESVEEKSSFGGEMAIDRQRVTQSVRLLDRSMSVGESLVGLAE